MSTTRVSKDDQKKLTSPKAMYEKFLKETVARKDGRPIGFTFEFKGIGYIANQCGFLRDDSVVLVDPSSIPKNGKML